MYGFVQYFRTPALWIVVAGAFVAGSVRAQAPALRFEPLNTAHGLPDNTVYDILQDRQGFLWFATEGGLARYDGYAFTTYRFDPSDAQTLSTNLITALLEDADGFIWAGTNQGGVNRLDPRTGRIRRYPIPNPGGWILRLGQSADGVLWAYDARRPGEHELLRLDAAAGRFVAASLPKAFPQQPFDLLPHGVAWTARPDAAYRYDLLTDSIRTYPLPASAATMQARPAAEATNHHVIQGADEAVWILGHPEQVIHLDPTTGDVRTHVVEADGQPYHEGSSVVHAGRLWMPSNADGLRVTALDSGRNTRYRAAAGDPYSLPGNQVNTLFADRSGILWVGTLENGLGRVVPRRQQFQHHYRGPDRLGSLAANHVYAFFEDRQSRFYVATTAGGLQRLHEDTGTFSTLPLPWPQSPSGVPASVRGVAEDSRGHWWLATWGSGILRLDPATGRLQQYAYGDRERDAVRTVLVDRQATIWAGAELGLLRFDPASDRFVPFSSHEPDASRWTVWTLLEDRKGRFWVGTHRTGLHRLDRTTGAVHSYRHDPSDPHTLSSDNVAALYEDEAGYLWVGTYGGGLSRLDPDTGRALRFTSRDGLPDNHIHAILDDGQGKLWLSTNGGLAHFDPEAQTVRHTYFAADGLQGDMFNVGAALQRRDGTFFFGGPNGFNAFNPLNITRSSYAPNVAFTSFHVQDRALSADSILGAGEPLRIPWARNEFSFELAVLDFTAPARNQFAYFLEGHDAAWRSAGTRRYASYSRLAPGRYTLRVRGANGDGVWSERGLALPLYVVPPFWMTAWFRGLVLTTTLLAFALGIRYAATRKLNRQVRALELERRVQAERERISRDLHDHVGAQLTYVIASLDFSARQLAAVGVEPQQHQLLGLRQHVHTTMSQLRETIWALRQETVTLDAFAERLQTYIARQLAPRAAPRLHLVLAPATSHQLPPALALNLFRIVQEAVTNVLKHAEADHLCVRLEANQGRLVVEVEDDGGGFAADDLPRPSPDGYGLENMRRRAADVDGSCTIDSSPGGGTRVCITVPLA